MKKYFEEAHNFVESRQEVWGDGNNKWCQCLLFSNDCSRDLCHYQLLVLFFYFHRKPSPFACFITSCPFFLVLLECLCLFYLSDMTLCFSLAAKFDINSITKCQKINILRKHDSHICSVKYLFWNVWQKVAEKHFCFVCF